MSPYSKTQFVGGLLGSVLVGCATPHATMAGRSAFLTTKPVVHQQSVAWHLVDVTLLTPVAQGLNVGQVSRTVMGYRLPASDLVNGQVPDGSFFTNRHISTLSLADIRRGPTVPGHELRPPLTITKLKTEGKTAGFFATDAKGDRFLCKLDLPDYPELLTGAEVVASKLIWALGYYVPSYEIAEVSRDQLLLSPKVPMTSAELDRLLEGRWRDGKLRMSASHIVDGEILGPIHFKDYRPLAELRGLKLAYAWVNNTDAKDHNSLLVWTGDKALGYLIDFGSSFGADASRGPKLPCQGWLNDVDLSYLALELVTLGLHSNGCGVQEKPSSPPVGLFSPRLDPRRWKPYAPNLAFDAMTLADAQWMARRLAQFSHAQLEAATEVGHYRDSNDAQRIVDTLEARRAAILQIYLPTPAISPTARWRPVHAPLSPGKGSPKLSPVPHVAQ